MSNTQEKWLIIKTFFLLAIIISLPGYSLAVIPESEGGHHKQVRWQYNPSWEIEAEILDMVHSLDGKHVFFLTGNKQIQIFTAKGELLGVMPVDAGVTHIDISPVGDKLYLFNNNQKSFTTASIVFQQTIDTTGAPMKGDENAPISIVIFTDFQCPYCKKLPPVLDEIEKNNQGKVRIFFKNMPLIAIHNMAEGAARAAIAAKNQGKFWPYHDKLFAAEKLTPEKLHTFAKELQLDMAQFEKDMQAPETTKALQQDMYDAQKATVEGTPTIFINGWPLGDRSVEGFQKMIDTLSAEKK